jgi:hypothetical protein
MISRDIRIAVKVFLAKPLVSVQLSWALVG